MSTSTDPQFELRFESLFERDCYVFPCDAKGHVDLDALSERDLNNYFYARHAIGREVARPAVCEIALHSSFRPKGDSGVRALSGSRSRHTAHAAT